MLIAHLDLDCFYAACEVLDRPELGGQPLIVGGDPHGRGVVATASYEARAFGIQSAMSCAEALRRCPRALFVRPDFDRYRRRSREVWALVRTRFDRVEQVGIDEGYIDVAAAAGDPVRATELLAALQLAIAEETGLSASIGCADGRTTAKIASDFRKPRGLTIVPPGHAAGFLAPMAARVLPGVGPRLGERLAAARLETIGHLAGLDDDALAALRLGKIGRELRDRARGIDGRGVVTEPSAPVSQSVEETFERDLATLGEMDGWIDRMAAELWRRLQRDGLTGRTVTAKLRYRDFRTVTRSQTLIEPVASAEQLRDVGRLLLRRAVRDRDEPVRLLGVGVSGLAGTEALNQLRLDT